MGEDEEEHTLEN